MTTSAFRFTPHVLADIRRLAGTMPGRDIAGAVGCEYSSLRTIASKHGISLRYGTVADDADHPAADSRAVARIDAMRPRNVELNGLILSADVMKKLAVEATARQTSVKALVAAMTSLIAIDGLVGAVIGDR